MRLWHLPCVYRGAPLVEVRIRLSSPAFLTFPPNVTHAFFALWRDACGACAAAADVAGLSLSFSNVCDDGPADLCTVEGVTMTVAGFSGSTQRFAADVFECLAQMCGNLAALEHHRMQQAQPPSNGTVDKVETGGANGHSNGAVRGAPAAFDAAIAMQDDVHAMHAGAPTVTPAPSMHHENVAEGQLMEEVALRRLDAAATAQLDEVCCCRCCERL